jgi:coproporphyrinogen III oxidase-like Fe-S oxidoreductase
MTRHIKAIFQSHRSSSTLLSPAKEAALELANRAGHGKAFVISYPDKLLTTSYWLRNSESQMSTFSFLDYAKTSTSPSQSIGLYLHLPFCEQKCSYCNFSVSTNSQEDYQTAYLDRLIRDLELFMTFNQAKIHSIDIGGGTPLLLSVRNLETLSKALAPIVSSMESYNATKFSFEQTSKIATLQPEKMSALISAFPSNLPVRTSMGIQSISTEVLNRYKRSSTSILGGNSHIRTPTEQCRQHLPRGSHISADLIFPLGKTEDFIATIQKTIELEFDTITAYDLIDNYGGGIRKAFLINQPCYPKEAYGQFYDIFYEMMIRNGYVLRYGSNNAIRKKTLDHYLQSIHGISASKSTIDKEIDREDYLDYASRYAVSHYYHDRISLGNEFIGFGVGSSSKLMNLEREWDESE